MLLRMSGDARVESANWDLLYNLRLAIIGLFRRQLRDLSVEEAGAALDDAAGTARAVASGLIYEHRSQSPRVQMVADELKRVLTSHIRGERGFRQVGAAKIREVIDYLRRQFSTVASRGQDAVGLTAQFVGRSYTVGRESTASALGVPVEPVDTGAR
jgi:hypothetical protein